MIHILWCCPSAADIWVENNSPVKKWAIDEGDFMTLWDKMSNGLKKEKLEWTVVIMHRIWLRRNMLIF